MALRTLSVMNLRFLWYRRAVVASSASSTSSSPDVNDDRNGVATVATMLRNERSPRPTMTVIRRLLFTPAEMLAPMGPAWNPADPPRLSPKPTWALALWNKQKRVSSFSRFN